MKRAPFYSDISEAPSGETSCWIVTSDDIRLRLVYWPQGRNGTVLFFSGRTEFAEKYGRTVADFQERGFACAVVDWRGQGLSDRLAPNRKLGHVVAFQDYQKDVAAMVAELERVAAPKPWFLCSHSMGGAIALRALIEGLPVSRSVFSSPMWGLTIDSKLRPLVQAIAASSMTVGLGEEFAPGTGPVNYVRTAEFEGNTLTFHEDSWEYLKRLVTAHPGLEIGGPSILWLYEALTETRDLRAMAPPNAEVLCMIGSDEAVVDKADVLGYMAKWHNACTCVMSGAQHEILMESPDIQKRALDMIEAFYLG